MPTADGLLTTKEREKIHRFLADKFPGQKCPVCATTDWLLDYNLARLDVADWKQVTAPAVKYFPMVVLQCANCGMCLLFNAVHLDIVPRHDTGQNDTGEARITGPAKEDANG